MGLKNAGSCFQRFIDTIFQGLDFVKAYIDDVIIFSQTEEEHLCHLREVLSRMNRYGLVVNADKSKFAVSTITFLGFEIGNWGYRPSASYSPKVDNLTTPKNQKELQRILGVLNFYRNHIHDVGNILAPVYKLLSPKRKFIWGQEQEDSLDKVKILLKERFAFKRVDVTLPFDMYTDASQDAVGAVLMQHGGIVGFFSKRLSNTERRYGTFDREALAK
jgi:hypothetical protein